MYFLKPVEGLWFLRVVCPEPALSSAAPLLRVGSPRGAVVGPAGWVRAAAGPVGGPGVGAPARFSLCPLWPRQTSVLGVLAGPLGRRLGSPEPSAPPSRRQLPNGTPASLLSLGCLWPGAPLLAVFH